jgi:hypothetical protein
MEKFITDQVTVRKPKMSPGARKWILLRRNRYSCPNRILFDITGNCPEITFFIDYAGMVSAFPQPSGTIMFSVYVLCIAQGDTLHHFVK